MSKINTHKLVEFMYIYNNTHKFKIDEIYTYNSKF